MFDISEKLASEQEENNNVDKNYWKNHSWKQLSLIGDETVINLQRSKVSRMALQSSTASADKLKKRLRGAQAKRASSDEPLELKMATVRSG